MSDFRIESDPSFAEMRKMLREIGGGKLAKQLQKGNKKIAVWLADEVESDYSSEHPRQSGHGANSIRARATQTDASIWMGSDAAPYVLGQNFGSNQAPNTDQFRDREEPDYFLYANIEENFKRIEKEHLDGIDDVFKLAYPD